MTEQSIRFKYKSFLVVAFCLVCSLSAFAVSEKNHLLVTQNLSKKLQNDLASGTVEVKLNNVEEYAISKNEVGLKGAATCVLTDKVDQLAIEFVVTIDAANQSVSNIEYDFVENVVSYAPTSNEEFLMKELMTKLSSDYKTENIVIAIDAVENVESANNEKKFTGIGEVRIGDLVWNKINFDVVLNAQTQKANKISYKIEK